MTMRTLQAACELFIQHLRDSGLKAKTVDDYSRIIGLFTGFLGGKMNLQQIKPVDVV